MVDSGDRSLAKRYMFLWFLTLAGLSIEPIADSVVGPWIPMYEGFKIIVAGWLLLAHFYLTKPGTDRDADPGWVTEDHYQHAQYPLVDSNSQPLYLTAAPRAASTASTQKHAFQPVDRIVTSSASDLDFGRFKRELVRRQTSGSIHSHTDLGFSASVSRVRRPNSTDLYPTTSASALTRARSPANAANGNMLIPSAATAPLTNKMSHSALEIYKFGVGAESRKRPFSAASSLTQNPRSISRQGSRRSHRMDHSSAVDVDPMEPDTSNSRMTKRTRQMLEEEYAGEVAAERASSRVGVVAGHTLDIATKRQQQQGLLLGTEKTATAIATRPPLRFPRPKPPGRNRKELLPHSAISSSRPKAAAISTVQRQDSGRSESRLHTLPTPLDTHSPRPPLRTEPVSANLESRMKSVRNWLKERKPSMISPPLSAKSEFSNRFTGADNMNDLRAQHNTTAAAAAINKRKAQRQLPPRMGSKRQAHGGQGYGLEEDGHGRIYPAIGDTVASVPPPHLQRHESSSSQPSRRAALARGSSGGSFLQSPDPQRDQPTSDPFFPPVNWSRFQKRNSSSSNNNNTNHNQSSAPPKNTASSASAFPTSAFTFRMKNTPGNSNHNSNSKSVNPFLTSLFSGDSDDNNAIISPLIKLRQSQLKQRQQEDFLGIGRDDSPAASRRFEEEGGLTFNETLEAWQREDDDVLAQNAAREAAEYEARGQGLGLGHGHARNESSFSSDEGRKSTSLSNNLPSSSMGANKHTSPPSLLRTVEFNGQSSRRSEPDLHAKKQDSSSTPLRPHKDVGASHTARAVASPRRTASLQTLSSSFGRGASRLVKSMSYPGSRTADSTGSGRRQRHPGLYTPSKKKPTFDMASLHTDPPPPQSPHKSTPTGMSRYIQLSALSDSEDV
ncbi:hypothetical protein BGZ98_006387 [Dissophora globulifera]|nr:hypothetical protein BGZ98_006387 [Dissophora globulifera]